MVVALSLPSRGRPARLLECLSSARETAEGPVLASIRLDDDDRFRGDYLRGLRHYQPVKVTVGPRVTLGRAFDEAARTAVEAGAGMVMMCGDDIRFRTPGWDRMVGDAFHAWPDRIGLVYGRDGLHDEKLATHGFVSRQWVEAIGFVPHQLLGNCADTWLHQIALRVGRVRYLPDLYTEHLHPRAGKAEMDATYRDRVPHKVAKAVYRSLDMEAAVRRLRQAMEV